MLELENWKEFMQFHVPKTEEILKFQGFLKLRKPYKLKTKALKKSFWSSKSFQSHFKFKKLLNNFRVQKWILRTNVC